MGPAHTAGPKRLRRSKDRRQVVVGLVVNLGLVAISPCRRSSLPLSAGRPCRRSSFRAAAFRPPLVVDPTLFGIRPSTLSPGFRPPGRLSPGSLVACRPSALWSTAIYHYHATLWFVNLVAGQPGFRPLPYGRPPLARHHYPPAFLPLSAGLVALPALLSVFRPSSRPFALSAALPHQRQPAWLGLQSVFGHRLVSNHYPMAENRSSGLPEAFLAGYE